MFDHGLHTRITQQLKTYQQNGPRKKDSLYKNLVLKLIRQLLNSSNISALILNHTPLPFCNTITDTNA